MQANLDQGQGRSDPLRSDLGPSWLTLAPHSTLNSTVSAKCRNGLRRFTGSCHMPDQSCACHKNRPKRGAVPIPCRPVLHLAGTLAGSLAERRPCTPAAQGNRPRTVPRRSTSGPPAVHYDFRWYTSTSPATQHRPPDVVVLGLTLPSARSSICRLRSRRGPPQWGRCERDKRPGRGQETWLELRARCHTKQRKTAHK